MLPEPVEHLKTASSELRKRVNMSFGVTLRAAVRTEKMEGRIG
jgi:hypothetical protein